MNRTLPQRRSNFADYETPEITAIIRKLAPTARRALCDDPGKPGFVAGPKDVMQALLDEKLIEGVGPSKPFKGRICRLTDLGVQVREALELRTKTPPKSFSKTMKDALCEMAGEDQVTWRRNPKEAYVKRTLEQLTALGYAERTPCTAFCFCETGMHWRLTALGVQTAVEICGKTSCV
jgi:hypothetical protein